MTDAAAKSSVQAGTACAERRPRIAANEQQSLAVQAMHALHAQGGNRAVTQTLGGGRPLAPDVQAEMEGYFGESRFRFADDSAAELEALREAESIPEKVLKKMRLGD